MAKRIISIMHNDTRARVRRTGTERREGSDGTGNRQLSAKCFAIIICNTSASASALGGHSGLVIRRAQWRASGRADGGNGTRCGVGGAECDPHRAKDCHAHNFYFLQCQWNWLRSRLINNSTAGPGRVCRRGFSGHPNACTRRH